MLNRTCHGFKFGSSLVEAIASDDKRGWSVVGIATQKHRVQVYATKMGKVRVFMDNVELTKRK